MANETHTPAPTSLHTDAVVVNSTPPAGTPTPPVTNESPSAKGSIPQHLELPETVNRKRILWDYVISLVAYHLLALLAFWPYLFSWTGVVLAVLGLYVFGTLGINLCYHRLLTHRGFVCPKWLEYSLALIGVCCLQDSPARWVAIHRIHHQFSDERPDPHSPLVAFFWGHVGWLLVDNTNLNKLSMYDRYARDLMRERFYVLLERNYLWFWINIVQAVLFFAVGYGAAWLLWGADAALQFGLSVTLWGVVVRTVAVWHITWSVNSVTHLWGYQNYQTGDSSRNNWLVGLWANGEGWHNNHHADQRSASHGHHWWEFDVTYLTIRLLAILGLATDVVTPNPKLTARDG